MISLEKSAFIRGAICGSLWWPQGSLAGSSLSADLRAKFHRFARPDAGEHISFRDALLSMLRERGGDFQNVRFAAGTELVLERREWSGVPCYQRGRTVTRGIPIEMLPDCADLVNADAHCSDF